MSLVQYSSSNSVTEVKIAHKGVDDTEVAQICAALLNNSFLTTINLETFDAQHNRIGDKGVEALSRFLRRKKVQVGILDLSCNTIWGEAMGHLSHPSIFSSLEVLILNNNHIGDLGVMRLFASFGPNNENIRLKGLHLDHNGIEDAGAHHVAAILLHNTTLTEVSLNDNKLTNISADLFKEVLETNTELTKLYLTGNRIEEDGLEALAEGAKAHPKLVVLDIMNNPGSLTGCPVSIEEVVLSHRLAHLHAIRSQFVLGLHPRVGYYSPVYTLLKDFVPSASSWASKELKKAPQLAPPTLSNISRSQSQSSNLMYTTSLASLKRSSSSRNTNTVSLTTSPSKYIDNTINEEKPSSAQNEENLSFSRNPSRDNLNNNLNFEEYQVVTSRKEFAMMLQPMWEFLGEGNYNE